MTDRRAMFFLVSAVVCALLVWPCPAGLRWVGITLATTFVVLAIASWLDHRGREEKRIDARTPPT